MDHLTPLGYVTLTANISKLDNLQEKFSKVIQRKIDEATKSFPVIHQQFINMKGWLRGTHDQWSEKYYQKYLDEYCFSTNGTHNDS